MAAYFSLSSCLNQAWGKTRTPESSSFRMVSALTKVSYGCLWDTSTAACVGKGASTHGSPWAKSQTFGDKGSLFRAASEVCSAVGADIWSKGDDAIVLLRTRSWHAGCQVHQAGKYPDAQ